MEIWHKDYICINQHLPFNSSKCYWQLIHCWGNLIHYLVGGLQHRQTVPTQTITFTSLTYQALTSYLAIWWNSTDLLIKRYKVTKLVFLVDGLLTSGKFCLNAAKSPRWIISSLLAKGALSLLRLRLCPCSMHPQERWLNYHLRLGEWRLWTTSKAPFSFSM